MRLNEKSPACAGFFICGCGWAIGSVREAASLRLDVAAGDGAAPAAAPEKKKAPEGAFNMQRLVRQAD
ncbi:TPA: hypothetical protein SAY52_006582 [Burkholderia cenocepacia]|uniref:hypothetical protein n=1 Tax=unclassified Burkholderia TaxID=2613784 RepID=UPI00158D4AC8|nr:MULTISPECIES: hypothetical protein [unclassified Burkholderia]HEF5875867.1 hypothetical protein [Burkholderia cenocepacia]